MRVKHDARRKSASPPLGREVVKFLQDRCPVFDVLYFGMLSLVSPALSLLYVILEGDRDLKTKHLFL